MWSNNGGGFFDFVGNVLQTVGGAVPVVGGALEVVGGVMSGLGGGGAGQAQPFPGALQPATGNRPVLLYTPRGPIPESESGPASTAREASDTLKGYMPLIVLGGVLVALVTLFKPK